MDFEEKNDNTRVVKPIIYEPIKRVPLLEYIAKHGSTNQPVLKQDNRTKKLKEENHKQGKAQEYVDNLKNLRRLTGQVLGVGAGLVGLGLIQGTPIGPYVDAALVTHSGYNLAKQVDKGTLGFNAETGLNTLGLIPAGFRAIPYISQAGSNVGKYIGKWGNYIREQSPIFIPAKNSYTRGIGRGTEGITDLVNSGVVRGNPRGTEVTAHYFAKLWRNNRLHFKDIMKDTGIPNIELKFFSRNLSKQEFEAIKNVASRYNVGNSLSTYPVSLRTVSTDPLLEYGSYDDYIKAVQQLVSEVESMTGKIKSGEVKVNTKLLEHENGLPTGTPILERFGPNSDYVGDGHPLTYWYPDGRNPFKRGYDYAGSDWGVRVLNADSQTPFMHDLHLHPSFFYTPRLDSPNVLVFRRLPFGLGLRVPKNWVKNKFGDINNKTISKSVISNPNTGELLYTPDELVKSGDFAKGKEMTVTFFEHPVILQSYKHNLELAKRLGITIPDKNASEVVKQPVKIAYKKLDNEIANVALSHYGDPDAVITMNWAMYPLKDLRLAVIHENLHRGFYSAPLRLPSMSKEYYNNIYKPEYRFWEWKTKKLLKPEYHNGYLADIHSGEAGANFIDLGRGLGLKLGLKYPGYEAVKAMLENYKGFKSFMIPLLNDSKAGMRHVWDAMTGKYFTPTAVGIGTSSLIPTDKKGSKMLIKKNNKK